MKHKTLLIFVDGIGVGTEIENPFVSCPTPTIEAVLGGPLTRDNCRRSTGSHHCFIAVDACLGVSGLPQSATGQTTLFTGRNAAAVVGRHVPAFPGPRLRSLLRENSLYLQAQRLGFETAFANAFSEAYFQRVEKRPGHQAATVWAAAAAGVDLRRQEDLSRGQAVSWDVCGDHWPTDTNDRREVLTPQRAGRRLTEIASAHDLTVYETFITDLAGHRRGSWTAREALRRLDGLLEGLLTFLPKEMTVVLTSDHGNLEEAHHRSHTRNPVPLLALGPRAPVFESVCSLTDVCSALLRTL